MYYCNGDTVETNHLLAVSLLRVESVRKKELHGMLLHSSVLQRQLNMNELQY